MDFVIYGGLTSQTALLTQKTYDILAEMINSGGNSEHHRLSVVGYLDKSLKGLGGEKPICAKVLLSNQKAHANPLKIGDIYSDHEWSMSGFDAIVRSKWGMPNSDVFRSNAETVFFYVTDGNSHVQGDVKKFASKDLPKLTKADVEKDINAKCNETEYVSTEDVIEVLRGSYFVRLVPSPTSGAFAFDDENSKLREGLVKVYTPVEYPLGDVDGLTVYGQLLRIINDICNTK